MYEPLILYLLKQKIDFQLRDIGEDTPMMH